MNNWLSITEYSVKNNISPSTIRRHIKTNKIKYKKKNGKYLIYNQESLAKKEESNLIKEKEEIIKIQKDFIINLRGQIEELKMLVKLLEKDNF
jgi:sulfur relay (sulfurtransferase) DsrC/TusE family protein